MAVEKQWYAEGKENVKGVVSLKKKGYGPKGTGFGSEWAIDLEELSKITNGHPEFIGNVKDFLEKNGKNIYNAVVYRSFNKNDKINDKDIEQISIVFDVADIYISLFSCSPQHAEGRPFVINTSYNKSYVWQMASML